MHLIKKGGMELRNYQKKALEKAHCWFEEETTYPLIVLPTGAGKTIVFYTYQTVI